LLIAQMKKAAFTIILFLITFLSFADHLKGGWIYYEYLGNGSGTGTSKYKITVKQYMRCDATAGQYDPEVFLGIFDGGDNSLTKTVTIKLSGTEFEQKLDFTCVPNPPEVCYRVDQYDATIDLLNNPDGYILSVQRCCRVNGIINVVNSGNAGLTYTNTIPGLINGVSYRNNSSPIFKQRDTAIVCRNTFFTFDFGAGDPDADSLSYSFVGGFFGGGPTGDDVRPNPPIQPPPPYVPGTYLTYSIGYSGTSPMGAQVKINSSTGLISGTAPNAVGTYVVAVAVMEYRDGVLIGSTRKEIHIDVGDCQLAAAELIPKYISCNGYSLTFKNGGSVPAGSTYTWNFGDLKSGANNISSQSNPTHVYSDTGVFAVKLKIVTAGRCEDSASTLAYVFPYFSPGFITQGQCKNTQIQFLDTTKTTYGSVDSWSWNFGDPSSNQNASTVQNPQHSFGTAGNYDVTFSATNNKGCSSTLTKTLVIKDKPDLQVTSDTLICFSDTLGLGAAGTGTFFWTPGYNISNQTSSSPLVSPDVATMYYVTLTDPSGCKANDSVFIDVKQFVTLNAGNDTSICRGDVTQLSLTSDALNYKWSPAAPLNNDALKNPAATPLVTTKFYVTGNIGKCVATDSLIVQVTPYPAANNIPDVAICPGQNLQFNSSGGSIYSWSPAFFLNDSNIPNPVASPLTSIRYIVTIRDTLGCPKPVYDTINVQVQKVIADAGPSDTSIVVNQPLQLIATGGDNYLWTPSTGLNNSEIFNPVATINDDIKYVVKVSSLAGCTATDTITVKVYKLVPDIYVPNAFTPGIDGKNDIFRPIPIGMRQINYFKVFNRWGILVYASGKNISMQKIGWDGRYKEKDQDGGVFVWIAEGLDYLGNKLVRKGTVTLIR
jgi:gliding motility-associated-like protein